MNEKNSYKKQNSLLKFTFFVLFLTIITTIAISSTFAKFASKGVLHDTATVAKWSFKVNGIQVAGKIDDDIEFNIFKTIENEEHLATNDGTIVAPGTTGSFNIELLNDSEVNAEYRVSYSVSNPSNIPIEFSQNGGETWAQYAEDVLNSPDFKPIKMNETQVTPKVQWRWAFSGDNEKDSMLGKQAGTDNVPVVNVRVRVEAYQVD